MMLLLLTRDETFQWIYEKGYKPQIDGERQAQESDQLDSTRGETREALARNSSS
jgi:hypothetical protein